jgi:DNA-binding LytR/AlgR family response regulator
MLTAVIIDDDKMSGTILEHFCEKNEDIQLLRHFSEPQSAMEFLKQEMVDLLFLDVEMPGLNGFDLLDKLDYHPYVILTSGKSEYAFLGFEYQVVDFLKKPVHYSRFKAAVDKLINLRNVPAVAQQPEEIFIRQKEGLVKVPFQNIYYVEVIDDYLKFHTSSGTYMVLGTLKYLEQKLDPSIFIKPHRSWIVNIKFVEDFTDGKLLVKGKLIPVSKQNKMNVVKRLNIL